MHIFAVLLLCQAMALRSAKSLKVESVDVPSHKVKDNPVELGCNYDLGEDTLYSVKWYRNSNEFFRYIPADTPPMQIFDLPGVKVDTEKSDSRRVVLRSVNLTSSGRYKCEVSADIPSFHTESKSADMLVVALPKKPPTITGGQPRYHSGDQVHVNCTSAHSYPAASLRWYVNGEQAQNQDLVEYAPEEEEGGLMTARLGFRFLVGARHFPNGELKLKCTATIAAVYWQSSEEAVEGQMPQTGPALESKGVYTGSSDSSRHTTSLFAICFLITVSFGGL